MVVTARNHNGVPYLEHSVTVGVSTASFKVTAPLVEELKHCIGKIMKFKYSGPVAVVEMVDSWKYPPELHITTHVSHSDLTLEEAKKDSKWSRVETVCGPSFTVGVQWLARGLDSIYEGTGKPVKDLNNIATFM